MEFLADSSQQNSVFIPDQADLSSLPDLLTPTIRGDRPIGSSESLSLELNQSKNLDPTADFGLLSTSLLPQQNCDCTTEVPPASEIAIDTMLGQSPVQFHCGETVGTRLNSATLGAANEIIFIDPRVDDYQTLIANPKPWQQIVVLDPSQDSIGQISTVLAQAREVTAVHLVSHAQAGDLSLGATDLNASTLAQYADQLRGWSAALTTDADVLVYGCNAAAGDAGQDLMRSLSQLTGADVAASTDLTGSAALEGDWEFEFNVGVIETAIAFDPSVQLTYDSVLPTDISAAQLNDLKAGLDKLMATLQAGIDTAVFVSKLPLVGDKLKETADFFTELQTKINNALAGTLNTAEEVETALDTALTGLGNISLSTPGDLEFTLDLSRSLLKETASIDFDLGIPALNLEVDGDVAIKLGYTLPITFGIDSNGDFYVDTSSPDELKIGLEISLPDVELTGNLAFLKISAKDDDINPTLFSGDFIVDILDPNADGKLTFAELNNTSLSSLFTPKLNADAKINLDLTASFGGARSLPSLKADFLLDWEFDPAQGMAGSAPNIQFNNVSLDLGTFFSDFVGPIFDAIDSVLEPIRPIIEVLETRMPIFSDIDLLKEKFDKIDIDGKVTLLEVAKVLQPDNSGVKFVETLKTLDQIVSQLPSGVGTFYIPLGSFNLTENLNGSDIRGLTDLLGVNISNFSETNIVDELENAVGELGGPIVGKIAAFLGNIANAQLGGAGGDDGAGLKFQILEDPASAFGLLLGQNVDLFTFDAPALKYDLPPLNEFFRIVGPLGVRLQGNFNVRAKFAFGFDTLGLTQFAEGDFANPELIFNGFFVSDRANPDGTGEDVAEVMLSAGIKASAALNAVVAEVGVGGGITTSTDGSQPGPLLANLNDGPDNDGKVRFTEIIDNIKKSPLCVFDISGQLIAALSAYVRVGADVPLVGFVGWQDSYNIAATTLLDFTFDCDKPPADPEPVLAQGEGGGVLRLNIGAYSEDRKYGDLEDSDEVFTVEHVSTQADGSETIRVSAFGLMQEYKGVRKIYAEGGIGNDVIDLKPGVISQADLWGDFNPDRHPDHPEFGDDQLFAGDGPATLHGGAGNDQLTSRIAAAQLFGDDGGDTLFGGQGNDLLDGGQGGDRLYSNQGQDTLKGSAGGDILDGGNGNDSLEGGADGDQLRGGSGKDTLLGQADFDALVGGTDDDFLDGGANNDYVLGDEGNIDPLVGNVVLGDGNGKDTLIGGNGRDALYGQAGADSLLGGTEDDFLSGGADADYLEGNAGNDLIFGDQGIPTLASTSAEGSTTEIITVFVPIPGALIPPFVQEQQQSFQFANGNIVQIFSTESSQDGKDKIHGNDGDDVVIGGGADDNIYGEEGADAILGDAGIVDFSKGKITQIASSLPTVSGNDTLDLGDDADIGIGGSGEDTIVGGTDTADDILLGDNGTVVRNDGTAQANDIFSTFPDNGGRDNLIGGAGNDIMIGGTAAEDIKGGTGNDIILGDHGTVNRGATDTVEQITTTFEDQGANDTIDGEAGADIALGGFGDDLISGGSDAANDILLGDNGTVVRNDGSADANDIFSQSPTLGGLDTISGGAGEDTIVGGTGGDQLSGEGDRDVVIGDHARINRNSADQIESVLTTFADLGGDDQVNGNQGDDILIGGVGKDTVDGATGDDIAQGDNGFLDYSVDGNLNTLDQVSTSNPTQGDRDTLIGAEGNDLLMGGTLSDWIDAGSGNDLVFGDHGRVQGTILLNALPLNQVTPPFTFTAIDTQLADLGGSETIQGGTGDDIILGQQGDDVLEGNDGDDDLIGGHNVAGGADGSDVIDGGVGQDAIAGDNASILRRADVQSPRIRVLSGTVIYDANGNPPITAAGQANPTGASARNIQVFDQSTTPTPGTFGNDNLAGGANDDLIFGQLGEDTVQGDSATSTPVSATIPSTAANTDGDDYIEGGGGNDLLFGNLGQDDMIGGSSSLFGGAAQRPDGSDTIFGGAGSAIVRNSLGDTTAAGHAKDADVIIGDNGNIFRLVGINGVSQNSYLKFNYDNYSPTIKIIPRAVQLLDYTPGGSNALGGDDLIRGEAGDDILYGMTGNDVAFGDGQDDNLFGGTGSDRLYGGTGEDGILGDDGLLLTSRNGLSEPLHGVTPPNQQTSISIPGPFIGAEIFLNGRLYKMADLLVPNSGGNDVIYGGLGDDFLHGGAGDDGISGAEALPSFYNANPVSNTNPLGYDPLTRKLAAYDANTPFTKVQGFFLNFDATTTGGAKLEDGKDYVFGDIGNDWLVGGTGKDRLFGGFGDDLLNGDDNHETNGGLNNRTDPAPFTDGDFAFGGAGLDVLIANTGGDRLFDWIGEFNSYFVPFSAFGYPTVNRSPSPHIQQFLLNLGRSAGADQTLTEPNGELGLVTQQDPQWQDQNGPPRDPQAGNLPGGGRDTRGAPENDAVGSGTPSLGTVFLSSDPSQPTRQALFVRGGDAADQIEIRRGSTASLIRVLINGVSQGEFNQSQVGRIIVYGGGGNDNISIFNDIGAIATLIYGEEGNDILRGGLSTNFIDGGSGNDTLSGNTGRDIIIGGLGQDQINGSSGDDILIGGSYLYAQDPVAIDSLIAAWGQALLYSQRVANLKLASNWFAFNNLTLTDDSVTDTLTGAQAQDWFLTTIADITDKKNNEVIN